MNDADVVVQVGVIGVETQRRFVSRFRVVGTSHLDQDVDLIKLNPTYPNLIKLNPAYPNLIKLNPTCPNLIKLNPTCPNLIKLNPTKTKLFDKYRV